MSFLKAKLKLSSVVWLRSCSLSLKANLSTKWNCSLFARLNGAHLYPGPQAQLKDRSFLPGATSETFPETLGGPREDFPIFFQANTDADLSPREWASVCREKLDRLMPDYSAVAFRGLPLTTPDGFDEFVEGCDYGNMPYIGGSGIRDQVRSQVYNASLEPPEYNIELHNELSYSSLYNVKILFFCLVPPALGAGGISAICNNRDVFKMIDPIYIEKFRKKGILYLRNTDNDETPGTTSWQNAFATSSKQEAEETMSSRGMEWKWLEGDRLRFWYKLDAFTLHPETGEELWFNQVHTHHCSYYKAHPDFQFKELGNLDYPFHSTYGDGEEIEPEFFQQLREASWRHAVGFPWQQGDVLVLDNMVAQHSRLSWNGNSDRKILVGLSSARTGQSHHGYLGKAQI